MSTEYSTIQQHQPLRTPASFDKQGRALIVQLDEILDDIYRRFGRLRIEDMGKAFRKEFSDAEGNIAQLELDVSGLTTRVGDAEGNISTLQITAGELDLAVQGIDGLLSGVGITAAGINITGNKYVKIQSGGSFSVDATNFKVNSSARQIVIGNWTFDSNGLVYNEPTSSLVRHNFGILFDSYSGGTFRYEDPIAHDVADCTLSFTTYNHPTYFQPPRTGKVSNFHSDVLSADEVHTPNGDITNVFYTTLIQNSSRELKKDVQDIKECGDKLDRLRPVSFVYKGDPEGKKRLGLIHEETMDVMPEICVGKANDSPERKAISYIELVPVLLKEIQSLRRRVARLEAMNHV